MHPRLEQWGELKTKGKSMRDLEAEYRAVQNPSEFSKNKSQRGDQKPSLHLASSSSRKAKPPTDPATLRRALEADRAAEAAMRNAPRRFDRGPGYPNDIPIRMVTNPWLSARLAEHSQVVPGSVRPPPGPLRYRPGRGLSSYQPNHQQSNNHQPTRQQWNDHQSQHGRQQAKQQQPNPPKSKPQQSKPNPPKPEQPGNNSHNQKSRKKHPRTNQSATRQSDQQLQDHAPRGNPSDGEPTTPTPNNQCRKKQNNSRHQENGATSPPRMTLKEKRKVRKGRQKQKEPLGPRKKLGEMRPRDEQTPAAQNPSEQNGGGQPTNPNARRPQQVKEEESDTEQLPSLSERFQPKTTHGNPETSAEIRVDHAPGRWKSRPAPTEARVGEQHSSMSTSFEERPFLRSPSYGTCAFTSPPPAESNQIPQSVGHAPTTPTSAPQPGVDGASPETSALARAIAQEMTDKLHAIHLSITDQFKAQNREITDQLDKQITQQKRRMAKLKKKTKVLADKIEGQTEMLKRHKTWMKKRSRKMAAASTGKRPRPSRATEEWEYIYAPIVGYSDDSTDETFVLSSSDEEEEENEGLSSIDEDEENEEEEEEDTDTDDDDKTDSEDEPRTGSVEQHAEEDILPSIESGYGSESASESESESEPGSDDPRTPARKLKRGRARETPKQSTGPRPAKKRRHGKAKETPVVNPYLDLIAHEREKARLGASRVGRCRCFRC